MCAGITVYRLAFNIAFRKSRWNKSRFDKVINFFVTNTQIAVI